MADYSHSGSMTTTIFDVIIIGGGAAGLSAALTLGRSKQKTLVIDAGSPRNRFAAHAHGVLGLDSIQPQDLLTTGREQARQYGVQFSTDPVQSVTTTSDAVRARTTAGETLEARTLIVATGMTDLLPNIPGLSDCWGKTVLHCPYCHGWEVRDTALAVLMVTEMGFHQAQLIRQWSDDVTVFVGTGITLPEPIAERLRARGMHIVQSAVTKIDADDGVIQTIHTEDGRTFAPDAMFTFGAVQPHDDFLHSLSLERQDTPLGSFLAVDATGKTSAERIWAVGNVANPGAAIPQAASEGQLTAAHVNMWLVNDDFDQAESERSELTPVDYWDGRYREKQAMWSGKPNAVLAEVASALKPGRALDLGCGEGADVIWLAQQGWQARGFDISGTAVARATAAAETAGLDPSSAQFEQRDLGELDALGATEQYDLVTASFLHSTVALPRTEILLVASGLVSSGGHLLITTHAAPPPWSQMHEQDAHAGHSHDHTFLTPQQEIEALDLSAGDWTVVIAESRAREAAGPNGERATLEDGVVLLRRT